jgi:hypothetical protein
MKRKWSIASTWKQIAEPRKTQDSMTSDVCQRCGARVDTSGRYRTSIGESLLQVSFAQACYYSSLSQPGALPVSGLKSRSKGFSTIFYGVGRSRIGTSETTRRTQCTDRLEWLRVSSHSYRVIPKYTRLTALI